MSHDEGADREIIADTTPSGDEYEHNGNITPII